MTDRVLLSVEGHIAIVTLNRPDKHNALDLDMFHALAGVGERVKNEPSVRAVVLEGAGPNFCAGIDVSIFQGGDATFNPETMRPQENSSANMWQRAAYIWREVPVPVICAIRGIAYGGGTQIALGADIRYASADARLSVMEIKWGIIPDMGITTNLTRCMPADRLKELALTGRVVSGSEACELGLVTAVREDPAQAARETAARIATKNPDAIRAIKRLFDSAWGLADADTLKLEASLQLDLLGKPNQVEAVMANVEGRDPKFADAGG